MHIKNFALISGLTMLMMGLIAFLPTLNVTEGLPPLVVNMSYGMFLDLFPMNIFNKGALIIFGVWGVMAYMTAHRNLYYSLIYSKSVFWSMGTLAVLGLFPETNTLNGYWPLFGFEIILHGTFALLGGYYGHISTHEETYHRPPQHLHKV